MNIPENRIAEIRKQAPEGMILLFVGKNECCIPDLTDKAKLGEIPATFPRTELEQQLKAMMAAGLRVAIAEEFSPLPPPKLTKEYVDNLIDNSLPKQIDDDYLPEHVRTNRGRPSYRRFPHPR